MALVREKSFRSTIRSETLRSTAFVSDTVVDGDPRNRSQNICQAALRVAKEKKSSLELKAIGVWRLPHVAGAALTCEKKVSKVQNVAEPNVLLVLPLCLMP